MTEPFYRDGVVYDAMNKRVTGDLDFYVEEARRAGSPILELACGTGRLSIPIANAGLEIVGVDLSESMLARAREKSDRVEWIQGDCRTLDLKRQFRLVMLPFNSLLLFHSRADFEAVCATVKRHLAPGGIFVFDIFNPNLELLNRGPEDHRIGFTFEDPRGAGPVRVEEVSRYDQQSQINHISWTFCLGDRRQPAELQMRCYFPKEMDALLHYNGFHVVDKYGDFQRNPFESSARSQIFRSIPGNPCAASVPFL